MNIFCRKFLLPSDKENLYTMDHFPVWYRRAAEYPAGRFLYYVPAGDNRRGRLPSACHEGYGCVPISILSKYILNSVMFYIYYLTMTSYSIYNQGSYYYVRLLFLVHTLQHASIHIWTQSISITLQPIVCSVIVFPFRGRQICDCCHICYGQREQKDSSRWR